MSTNLLGIKNSNLIIPYTAAQRRTKKVDFTFSNTPAGWTLAYGYGIAYADSSGNWRLVFNCGANFSPASLITFTIDGVTAISGQKAICVSDGAFGLAPSNSFISGNQVQVSKLLSIRRCGSCFKTNMG
jgi:hypothetical protein